MLAGNSRPWYACWYLMYLPTIMRTITGRTRFETQVLPLGSNLATDHVEPLENLVARRAPPTRGRGARWANRTRAHPHGEGALRRFGGGKEGVCSRGAAPAAMARALWATVAGVVLLVAAPGTVRAQCDDGMCSDCCHQSGCYTSCGCRHVAPGYYMESTLTRETCNPHEKACPAGKYTAASGSHGAGSCTNCEAGRSSGAHASSCGQCAPGKYAGVAAASCIDCAAGMYNGADGQGACINCAAGQFTPSHESTECQNCTAGRFSLEGRSACTSCEPGQYQPLEGQPEPCLNCDRGTYQPLEEQTDVSSCLPCAVGRYHDLSNSDHHRTNTSACTECPAVPGGGNPFAAFQAKRVENSGSGGTLCLGACAACRCTDGRYDHDADWLTPCVDCLPGTYSDGETCEVCAPGKFDHDENPASECSDCAAGLHTSTSGNTVCSSCAAGKYSPEGSAGCEACAPGQTDHDEDSATECISCAAGLYTSSPGNAGQCSSCAAGRHSPEGSTGCEACAPGQVDADSRASTPCTDCPGRARFDL